MVTRAEALELALDWAEGRRSHLNEMFDVEASTDQRPQTLAAVAQADAAEVMKWATLAGALDDVRDKLVTDDPAVRLELARQRALLILRVARESWRPEQSRLSQIEGEAEHFYFIASGAVSGDPGGSGPGSAHGGDADAAPGLRTTNGSPETAPVPSQLAADYPLMTEAAKNADDRERLGTAVGQTDAECARAMHELWLGRTSGQRMLDAIRFAASELEAGNDRAAKHVLQDVLRVRGLDRRRIVKSLPAGTHVHLSISAGPDDRDEYDDEEVPCCMAGAMRGPRGCTCWVPVYDLEQSDDLVLLAPVNVRPKCCDDCAYLNGSPEREEGYEDDLRDLAGTGDRFACHQGMRRVVLWRHPDGREIAAAPGAYEPPIIGEKAFRADGLPADLCAGWAAHRAALLAPERA